MSDKGGPPSIGRSRPARTPRLPTRAQGTPGRPLSRYVWTTSCAAALALRWTAHTPSRPRSLTNSLYEPAGRWPAVQGPLLPLRSAPSGRAHCFPNTLSDGTLGASAPQQRPRLVLPLIPVAIEHVIPRSVATRNLGGGKPGSSSPRPGPLAEPALSGVEGLGMTPLLYDGRQTGITSPPCLASNVPALFCLQRRRLVLPLWSAPSGRAHHGPCGFEASPRGARAPRRQRTADKRDAKHDAVASVERALRACS